MTGLRHWLRATAALSLAAGLVLAPLAFEASAATNTPAGFGFSGPEIFPIDSQISLLRVADLDGDGLNDLVVVNNARSRISLLYNQTGQSNLTQKARRPAKLELNELPADARFRLESIASEKRISALVVADLNGDGRPDIAYYGEPRELVVLYNQGTAGWSAPKHWPIEDGQLTPTALTSGDLNGDGLVDLLLLADDHFYLLTQQADHTLGEPQRIPFSGNLKAVQILDVDGDGRNDLLLANWEDRNPIRFRLQEADGQLGPEIYFPLPPIRAYLADNLEPTGRLQVVTIAQNSGRAQISEFIRKPAENLSGSFREGQFQVLPLNKTEKARRGLLWADVNGDGRPDLLIAEPESGQISIQLQQPDGSLAASRSFPSLAGVTELAVADWNQDGQPDIFMLSPDERQVGVTHFDGNQRLPFPTLIPLDGKPLAFAVGALQPGAKPTLAIIVDQDGRRSLVTRTADGKTRSQVLSESFKLNPVSLTFHDADQDGLADLVVLIANEKVKILRQVVGKDFEELDVALPGGAVEQPWLSAADVDGDGKPELLLPQKNFLRAVVLTRDAPSAPNSTNHTGWVFQVKDQINGAGSNSRLMAAAALPNGSNTIPSLFLLDAERKVLTLCERDKSGVWQVVRNLPLPVADFSGLQAIALGGRTPNALALLGLGAVACQHLGGEVWQLAELDDYETPIKYAHLNAVVSGDLDHDGRKDLVFLETGRNYLDLVIFDSRHKLVPANRWQVFEERTFLARRNAIPEPREAVVADVTGDHKNDLIVLVHDRILVYPQE